MRRGVVDFNGCVPEVMMGKVEKIENEFRALSSVLASLKHYRKDNNMWNNANRTSDRSL